MRLETERLILRRWRLKRGGSAPWGGTPHVWYSITAPEFAPRVSGPGA